MCDVSGVCQNIKVNVTEKFDNKGDITLEIVKVSIVKSSRVRDSSVTFLYYLCMQQKRDFKNSEEEIEGLTSVKLHSL